MAQSPRWKTALHISLLAGVCAAAWYLAARQVQARQVPAQQIVDHVEVPRLLGTWYEISRLPNFFQSEDWIGARDHYEPGENGQLKVFYKYYDKHFDQPEKVMEARMWRDARDEPSGKFKIQFFWPIVADYWIIDLGPNYEYLVVGYPNREMLWIMSRTPELDDTSYAQILARLEAQHYDTSKLIKIPHRRPDSD